MTTAAVTVDGFLELQTRRAAAVIELSKASAAVELAEVALGDLLLAGDEQPGPRQVGMLTGSRERADHARLLVAAIDRQLAALAPAGQAGIEPLELCRAVVEVRDGQGRLRAPGETFLLASARAAAAVSGGTVAYANRRPSLIP